MERTEQAGGSGKRSQSVSGGSDDWMVVIVSLKKEAKSWVSLEESLWVGRMGSEVL